MTDRRIEGMRELSAQLATLGGKVGLKALRAATRNAATPIVRAARLRVPVGTRAHRSYKGNLLTPGYARRSIKKTVRRRGRGRTVAIVDVGVRPEAFYAVQFLEVGTAKMAARAWLVPAFEAARDDVEQRLSAQLKRQIERLGR